MSRISVWKETSTGLGERRRETSGQMWGGFPEEGIMEVRPDSPEGDEHGWGEVIWKVQKELFQEVFW